MNIQILDGTTPLTGSMEMANADEWQSESQAYPLFESSVGNPINLTKTSASPLAGCVWFERG